MATVSKLSYANLKNKSKVKESGSSQPKEYHPDHLFAQMNQDNLKYIHSQIKQKGKKNNINTPAKGHGHIKSFPALIEEKESKYEETERAPDDDEMDQDMVVAKTEGGSARFMQKGQRKSKVSENSEAGKLSYYDLISQAKSKRMTSLQGDFQEGIQGSSTFLHFIDGYVSQLYSSSNNNKNNNKDNNKFSMKKPHNNNNNQQDKTQLQIQIQTNKNKFIEALSYEKKKNKILSKQIEKQRTAQSENIARISALEGIVTLISEEMDFIRKQVNEERSRDREIQMEAYRKLNMTRQLGGERNFRDITMREERQERSSYQQRQKQRMKQLDIVRLEEQFQKFQETGDFS